MYMGHGLRNPASVPGKRAPNTCYTGERVGSSYSGHTRNCKDKNHNTTAGTITWTIQSVVH